MCFESKNSRFEPRLMVAMVSNGEQWAWIAQKNTMQNKQSIKDVHFLLIDATARGRRYLTFPWIPVLSSHGMNAKLRFWVQVPQQFLLISFLCIKTLIKRVSFIISLISNPPTHVWPHSLCRVENVRLWKREEKNFKIVVGRASKINARFVPWRDPKLVSWPKGLEWGKGC